MILLCLGWELRNVGVLIFNKYSLIYKMKQYTDSPGDELELQRFLNGKTAHTLALFDYFISEFQKIGPVTLHPAKTMIGVSNGRKRIVYIIRLGKDFLLVVFPFKRRYDDNLCFEKIAQVPGDEQCNHYFRMLQTEDVNDELQTYMRIAYCG